MVCNTESLCQFARMTAPFALLGMLAALGVGEETLSGSFLVASFLCYLVIPSIDFDRRRLARK